MKLNSLKECALFMTLYRDFSKKGDVQHVYSSDIFILRTCAVGEDCEKENIAAAKSQCILGNQPALC